MKKFMTVTATSLMLVLLYSLFVGNGQKVAKPSPLPSPSPVMVMATVNDENAMVYWLNDLRESYGCKKLKENEQLTKAAQERAEYLYAIGKLEHDGYKDVINKYYKWSLVGENLVKGYWNAEASQLALIGSRDHRENMVECKFKDVGIGNKGKVWVQIFGVERK